LEKEEKSENRKLPGFDFGFVTSFVKSNLNTCWCNEYIYKQTVDYKNFAVICTLESYLKADEILKLKLGGLYNHFLENELNLEDMNTIVEVELPKNLKFLETENSKSPMLAGLENLKIDLIKKVFETKNSDFLPEYRDYFSENEVNHLINQNLKYSI
jgi:hypothetical protein